MRTDDGKVTRMPYAARETCSNGHIKPYSRGGETTVGNLQVTHSVCNMRKGASWRESTHA